MSVLPNRRTTTPNRTTTPTVVHRGFVCAAFVGLGHGSRTHDLRSLTSAASASTRSFLPRRSLSIAWVVSPFKFRLSWLSNYAALRPINRRKLQPPSFHFLAKFVGILLHAVTSKTMPPARSSIEVDLSPNVLVKCDQTFVLRTGEIHRLRAPTQYCPPLS
jgi:hypothetical protein